MPLLLACSLCTIRGASEPEVAEHTVVIACEQGHTQEMNLCVMHRIELDADLPSLCCEPCHSDHAAGHPHTRIVIQSEVER
jgi:hypothetical protein